MKRWIGGLVAVVALAGCSSTPQDPPPSSSAADAVFLDMAHGLAPGVPDANLLDVRTNFCKVLDEDPREGKYLVAVATLMKEDLFKDHAGELAGVFVASGCPQHADLVPGR